LSDVSYLLDTQILLWMDQRPEKITRRLQATLDAGFEIYFSAASAWEIAIKCSLGKLAINRPLNALAESFGFLELPVTTRYTEIAARLPLHHRDPFDRMMVAQAIKERLIFVTGDRRLAQYNLKTLQV
jgi:PIN domain nuclease of toxin-antitoxin system